MSPTPLYFDDLALGMQFKSATLTVTREDILRFAAEFDPQPFHLDDEAARKTMFGGLAASGWHTAALTMRLLVTSGPRLANGIIGAGGEVEWKMPTRPGDELHVDCEVIELTPSRSKPDRGLVVLRSNTVNQRSEVVQTLTAKLMVSRRAA
ncbi:MAG: MaoC family dehydratase [Pelomonas sp.]|nr:MaoC family dehydratase [Roseateles sp.]